MVGWLVLVASYIPVLLLSGYFYETFYSTIIIFLKIPPQRELNPDLRELNPELAGFLFYSEIQITSVVGSNPRQIHLILINFIYF